MENQNSRINNLLLQALEDLLEHEFKMFKDALSHSDPGEKGRIPRGQLEDADRIKTKNRLVAFYGADAAVDVTIEVFIQINLRDAAARLRGERQKDSELETKSSEILAKGYRKKYTEHNQEKYKYIKDRNSLLGEKVNLSSRYTKLDIVQEPRAKKKDLQEIMSLREKPVSTTTEQRRSFTLSELFAGDKKGETLRIVVLLGAAGIGKTMTARKIMFDWASGELYQNKFDYVFYIHCREFMLGSDQRSLKDLILTNCPDEHAPMADILVNPDKILFIVDGFDELRFSLDQPEDNLCSDPHEKKAVEITLSSLFRKKVLQKSYLLIATRPTALEKLNVLLVNERWVKILGFSETERKEYFDKYFGDEKRARRAFKFVRDNEMIFTMCSVPMVCWIICTVLEQQMDEGEDLAQSSETITGVYLHYLDNLLQGCDRHLKPAVQTNLKGLCSLATEGICKQKILFEAEELKKHGLDASDSRFLNENLFRKATKCECLYSFIHVPFQELFAALFYALENEEERTGRDSGNDIKDLKTLLADYEKSKSYLMLTVRFLFGLLNEKRKKDIEKILNCQISLKIKPELQKWIKTAVSESDTPLPCSNGGNVKTASQLEDFHCLYEIREKRFVQNALSHFTALRLWGYTFTKMDQVALAFCLKNCQNLEYLFLWACKFAAGELEEDTEEDVPPPTKLRRLEQKKHSSIYLLCEALKDPQSKVKKLVLWGCHLTPACCGDLAAVLSTSPSLTELHLSGNNDLGDGGMQQLCEGLRHPSCKLQTLQLQECGFTAACCGDLATALSTSPSLTKLHLSGNNYLGACGVRRLCEGLRHPRCKLQTLRLGRCGLTDACCEDLATALSTSPSLTELDLCYNEGLRFQGVQWLCKGLRHPRCKLQTLRLSGCCLKLACCGHLHTALRSSPRLTELDLSGNDGMGDLGVWQLCEGLKDPRCKLQTLGLRRCQLTAACCKDLATALRTSTSLTDLDLTGNNDLGDVGVQRLCKGLRHPRCKLETLRLCLDKLNAKTKQDLEAVQGMKPGLVIQEFGMDLLRKDTDW